MPSDYTCAAAGDPRSELARLVRSWRERLNPNEIPGLVSRYPRHRNVVSQEDMARLIGVSSVWYGKFERGGDAHYSDDFLDRTSIALRLNPDERMMLYLYSVGREPATRSRHRGSLIGGLTRVVHTQQVPTYISDDSWDIVEYNECAGKWFPWVVYERNLMRWVFTYPEARQQLHDWATDWAPLMLAQMRVASARQPDNTRLAELIREILDVNEDARALWEKNPSIYVHPDGDHRKMHVPNHDGLVTVEIVALSPLRDTNFRLVFLVPDEAVGLW